jgi:hypothetical protein
MTALFREFERKSRRTAIKRRNEGPLDHAGISRSFGYPCVYFRTRSARRA